MNLSHSVREISYNKFVVVDSEGFDVSSELTLDKAADLIRCFENADRMDRGLRLWTEEDMPAILAALAGNAYEEVVTARDAHTWKSCTTGCTPGGRKCDVYTNLWNTASRMLNWTRAPYATENRWGNRKGHASMGSALAEIWMHGGSVIKAPEGAYEAEMARQAEEKKAAEERRAARLAAGQRIRPPRR